MNPRQDLAIQSINAELRTIQGALFHLHTFWTIAARKELFDEEVKRIFRRKQVSIVN